jgi:hypothetical protein
MVQIFSHPLLPVPLSFGKGCWAAEAAKIGYQRKVGNGRRVKFWEDQSFGTFSLAIKY